MSILFGTQNIKAVIDLPSPLNHFVELLPFRNVSVKRIIQDHTLFPVYALFLTEERVQTICEGMCGDRQTGVHLSLGLSPSEVIKHQNLMFCPTCVAEERARYRECYWHRVHQVPGVYTCPIHYVWLEASEISVRGQYNFISAEHSVKNLAPRLVNEDDQYNNDLASVASDMAWLLDNPRINSELGGLRKCYLVQLYRLGLASYGGNVYTQKLVEAFKDRYAERILVNLGSSFEKQTRRNWLARLVQANQTQHPLRHLLLIHFLESTVEKIWSVPTELPKPFGEGPWLCFNPVCPFFRQPIIDRIQLGISHNVHRLPLGTFSCPHCGYTYRRIQKDESLDKPENIMVIQYGPLWNQAFTELLKQAHLSNSTKARELGISIDVFNSRVKRFRLTGSISDSETPSRQLLSDELIKSHQLTWLAEISSKPNTGMAELQLCIPTTYRILSRYDFEWLRQHTPMPNRSVPRKTPQVNWAERDAFWAAQVQQAVVHLLSQSNPLCRITANSIAKQMGLDENFIQKNQSKLPLTFKIVSQSVETHEDFAIRRIRQLGEYYKDLNTRPTKSEFVKKAGLSPAVRTTRVMNCLETILTQL